jgi:hypothetical protein
MRSRVPVALWCVLIALIATIGCRPTRGPEPLTDITPGLGEMSDDHGLVSPEEAAPQLPARDGLAPEQVAQAYYEWYMATMLDCFKELSDLDPVLQAEGYLHESLIERIEAERAAGLMADPILCAQDVPRSVRVIEEEREGPQANVLLGTSFEGHRIRVLLEEDAQGWQIVQVQCHPDQASAAPGATGVPLAPAEPGWVEYHNQEYGFAVQIPEEWTLKVLAQDPHMPPIGPPSLRLAVYMTSPEPESAAAAPFSLEFAIGDEPELDAMYGEPTSREEIEIGGLPAVREVEALGEDVALVRYVISHPRFPDRRVTLLDPISGFADRRATAGEALAQFDRVVASFRFVD